MLEFIQCIIKVSGVLQLLKQALFALIVFTIMTANSEDRDQHTYVPKSQRPATNSRHKGYFASLKARLKAVTLGLEPQVDNLQTRDYCRYKKRTRHPRDSNGSSTQVGSLSARCLHG